MSTAIRSTPRSHPPAASGAAPPLPPLARAGWPGAWAVALARDPLGTVQRLHARYGDTVRVETLGRTFVIVAHPEAAREVLVTQQRRFARAAMRTRGSGCSWEKGC